MNKRDWIFIGIILAVFGTFFLISGKEKTVKMPKDTTHQQFYDLRKSGVEKIKVDALCPSCHDGVKIAFPPNHPAKPGGAPMRCLFCHKLES